MNAWHGDWPGARRVFMGMVVACFAVCLCRTAFAADSPEPKKYALLVGVNKYEHAVMNEGGPLKYAEADATALAALLRGSGYEVDVLAGHRATQRAILDHVAKLGAKGNSEGVVLVGLAGHGVQFETEDEAYFCPYDAKIREAFHDGRPVLDRSGRTILEPTPESCVRLTDIVDRFRLSPAGTRILLADCCRNDPKTGRGGRAVGSGIKTDRLPASTAVLLSCGKDQKSWEDERWKHGAFFYHVLKGLEEGRGTVAQLHAYLEEAVPEDVKGLYGAPEQTPHFLHNASKRLAFGLVGVHRGRGRIEPLPPAPSARGGVAAGTRAGEVREFGGDLGIKFCWCPPGEFLMGSPEGDSDAFVNEKPQVRVTLSRGFWLGQTEVTQGEWFSVMGTKPWAGEDNVREGEKFPATFVSHGLGSDGVVEPDSAVAFCRKLTERERAAGRLPRGWAYRLPTEAEWEYACRAGTKTRYGFGDDAGRLGEYAWFYENARGIDEEYAHQVATKRANAWNLYDMHGNVLEWCSDWYTLKLPGGRDPAGPLEESLRVRRDGAWYSRTWECRSARRLGKIPSNRGSDLGFRLALRPSGE